MLFVRLFVLKREKTAKFYLPPVFEVLFPISPFFSLNMSQTRKTTGTLGTLRNNILNQGLTRFPQQEHCGTIGTNNILTTGTK